MSITEQSSHRHIHAADSPSHVPEAFMSSEVLPADDAQGALPGAQRRQDVAQYIHDGEIVTGYGYGGSESLTIFLEDSQRRQVVRKVLSERLITARWGRDGQGVMLPPHNKARRQAAWLLDLPENLSDLFPRMLALRTNRPARQTDCQEFIYDMSYVPGIELSRFVKDHKPAPAVVAWLYSEVFSLLKDKVHAQRQRVPKGPTLEVSYFSKIEQRLALSQETAPRTFSDELLRASHIWLNGKKMLNLPTLLKTFRGNGIFQSVLEPRYHSLVVGDTNTENIKLGNIEPLLALDHCTEFSKISIDAKDLQIRFLDPRAIGFHENGLDTGADDPMYDNKPWHNSIGNYDAIHGEHFDITSARFHGAPDLQIDLHEGHPYARSYKGIERHFFEAMTRAWDLNNLSGMFWRNDPYWTIRFAFLMGTHFMAMPPFHFSRGEDGQLADNAQAQKRPLAIYAEGIKWLNLALGMLRGDVHELFGFEVPDVSVPVRYPVQAERRHLELTRH